MKRPKGSALDELASLIDQREQLGPPKLLGGTTPGGTDLQTQRDRLPLPLGDVGDVATVVMDGADKVVSWEPPTGGGGGDVAVDTEGVEVLAAAARLDFVNGLQATDAGSDTAQVEPVYGLTTGTVAEGDDLAAAIADIATLTSDLSTLTGDVATLTSDLGTLTGDVATISSDLSDLTTQVNDQQSSFTWVLDEGGVPATNVKASIYCPFDGVIVGYVLLADQNGDIEIDVWRDVVANHPPTVADTRTGANYPTLSSSKVSTDTTLTSWTTSFSEGDVFAIKVRSAATVQVVTFSLIVKRT